MCINLVVATLSVGYQHPHTGCLPCTVRVVSPTSCLIIAISAAERTKPPPPPPRRDVKVLIDRIELTLRNSHVELATRFQCLRQLIKPDWQCAMRRWPNRKQKVTTVNYLQSYVTRLAAALRAHKLRQFTVLHHDGRDKKESINLTVIFDGYISSYHQTREHFHG